MLLTRSNLAPFRTTVRAHRRLKKKKTEKVRRIVSKHYFGKERYFDRPYVFTSLVGHHVRFGLGPARLSLTGVQLGGLEGLLGLRIKWDL